MLGRKVCPTPNNTCFDSIGESKDYEGQKNWPHKVNWMRQWLWPIGKTLAGKENRNLPVAIDIDFGEKKEITTTP